MSSFNLPVQDHSELLVLKAGEDELLSGADAALVTLGPPSNAILMRATLGILIRAKRYTEAADVVRGKQLDPEWIYWAAYVYKYIGDLRLANEVIRTADGSIDPLTMRRTRLFFADGFIDRIQSSIDNNSVLSKREWGESIKEEANGIIEILEPLISLVRANRAIMGDLQITAVLGALFCAHITDNHPLFAECCDWLIPHVPVPLTIAEICLRRMHDTPAGFANRLRVEHPGDFQANLLAAMIERDVYDRAEDAFDAIVKLCTVNLDAEKTEALADRLFETCCQCGPHRAPKAIEEIAKLQSASSPLIGLLNSMQRLHANDIEGAETQLQSQRDELDPSWWQAYATLCDKKGDFDAARDAWEKASELLPHPDLQRRAIQASLDRRKFESAVRGLTKLVERGDVTDKDRELLAWSLIQLGRYPEAVQQLEMLVSANPDSIPFRMTLAQCYSHCARAEDGVNVLRSVFDAEDPPLDAFFLQSQLLTAIGQPKEAFALLESAAGDYWDEPRFLLAFMSCGHAAGDDRRAHEAFTRLLLLRQAGKVPPEMLQGGSIEQLIALGTEVRARRELLQNEVVNGQKPWLFVEDDLGNPPVWAWTLHTQPMNWLSEDRLSRAAFTIYATNGFTAKRVENENRLEAITNAVGGSPIVVDLSALITLFQLGRLEDAANFASSLIVPSSYGVLQTVDAQRFGQHQPSQELSLQNIEDEIGRGHITIISEAPDGMAVLDEYEDTPDSTCYRLQDLIQILHDNQTIGLPEIQELREVAHKDQAVRAGLAPLQAGGDLRVDLLTLRTLATHSCFAKLLRICSFHLLSVDQAEIRAGLLAHKAAADARHRHDELWHLIADLKNRGKISWESTNEQTASKARNIGRDTIHIDSVLLANERSMPLVVDDRMLQVIHYASKENNSPAFGTDRLLVGMLNAKKLTISDCAKDFRQLMVWRYRFLVPSSAMLKCWADESKGALPGDALMDVAVYLHDSLRDPGLHCGLERSDPPMPMAMKLVMAWITSIANFLAEIWNDEEYSVEEASALTQWIGEECIPSAPWGLWLQPIGQKLARSAAASVMRLVMIEFTYKVKGERANAGLQILAQSIGMDQYELVSEVVETIDVIDSSTNT